MNVRLGSALQIIHHVSLCSYLTASTVGKYFFFGIPLLQGSLPIFEVIIGTPSNSAEFIIETSTGEELGSGAVSSTETTVVEIPRNFEVTSSGFEDRMKGIRVHSTDENEIYVLAIIRYNFNEFVSQPTGYSSWLVHPKVELKNQENFVSTDYAGEPLVTNRRSNILLVGNQDEISIPHKQLVFLKMLKVTVF